MAITWPVVFDRHRGVISQALVGTLDFGLAKVQQNYFKVGWQKILQALGGNLVWIDIVKPLLEFCQVLRSSAKIIKKHIDTIFRSWKKATGHTWKRGPSVRNR